MNIQIIPKTDEEIGKMKFQDKELEIKFKFNSVSLRSSKMYDRLTKSYLPKLEFRDDNLNLIKNSYKLYIDYPLSVIAVVDLEGIYINSKNELIKYICKIYQNIYEENENSNQSVSYGIWGHCLDDLVLHTIYIGKNGVISLGIDS